MDRSQKIGVAVAVALVLLTAGLAIYVWIGVAR